MGFDDLGSADFKLALKKKREKNRTPEARSCPPPGGFKMVRMSSEASMFGTSARGKLFESVLQSVNKTTR